MKKFLAVVLVGLMATSASAMNIWIVAKSGPLAWNGTSAPTLLNGGVGLNQAGGGLSPFFGGPGIVVQTSGTAKMGVAVQLIDGTINDLGTVRGPNQLSTAVVFFNQQALGTLGSVDLAGVSTKAVNDVGNLWHTINFSTGMNHWIGLGGVLTGDPNAPLIEDYHSIQFDDMASDPTPGTPAGGNSAGIAPFINLMEITVHGIGPVGAQARVTFDSGNSEFFNEGSGQYGFRATLAAAGGHHFGDNGSPGGYWIPGNGATNKNAFPIEVIIPEPATLSLLVIGTAAMLRRRK